MCSGRDHNCALKGKQVFCWGANYLAQIGLDPAVESFLNKPHLIDRLQNFDVKSVSCGWYHTCALLSDNRAFCWGINSFGELGSGSDGVPVQWIPQQVFSYDDIVSIVAVARSTCVVRLVMNNNNNETWCWGRNLDGELGIGSESTVEVQALRMVLQFPSFPRVLTAGNYDLCGIDDESGAAFCVGRGEFGQLGYGGDETRNILTHVFGLGHGVRDISSSKGSSKACAVMTTGEAKCWGRFETHNCCLGDGSASKQASVPVSVYGAHDHKQISVGSRVTCSIRGPNSEVWCWGNNAEGALGNGTVNGFALIPQPVFVGDP